MLNWKNDVALTKSSQICKNNNFKLIQDIVRLNKQTHRLPDSGVLACHLMKM